MNVCTWIIRQAHVRSGCDSLAMRIFACSGRLQHPPSCKASRRIHVRATRSLSQEMLSGRFRRAALR
ncbi:hypothetical protein E8E78_04015 [Pseudomonas sp. BN505]|nr:hypothetical protein [Pseudomonas sp. BN605]MDH4855775.1 hypothetical protein [Pseudomonas sp. BN505]